MALVHELPEALRAASRSVPAGPHGRPPLQREGLLRLRRRQQLQLADAARAETREPRLRV